MTQETERIELPGGGWWEIKAWLTRGDRKQIRRMESSWYAIREDATSDDIADDPRSGVTIDRDKLDLGARDDLMLQLGTVAWSFDGEFSIEACDDLRDEVPQLVIERMRELYLAEEAKVLAAKKA